MLTTTMPSPGLVFGSFLFRTDLHTGDSWRNLWEAEFGPSLAFTPSANPLCEYYAVEMGTPLSRIFFMSVTPFPREYLLSTKLLALGWEKKYASQGAREVNVDVGFLSPENFILATTKNYAHRIYLGQNIFADLTYYFSQGDIGVLPWTYPDYCDEEKKNFFRWARGLLLEVRNR